MEFKFFLNESSLAKLGQEFLKIAGDAKKRSTHEVYVNAFNYTKQYKTLEDIETRLIDMSKIQPKAYRIEYLTAARLVRSKIK